MASGWGSEGSNPCTYITQFAKTFTQKMIPSQNQKSLVMINFTGRSKKGDKRRR